jgi:hypothetical protein
MSYVSGRTVKTSRKTTPTTVASATRDARRLVARHLPGETGITVTSSRTADPATLATQVRTVVTHAPGAPNLGHLAGALYNLPGVVDCHRDDVSITIVRTA